MLKRFLLTLLFLTATLFATDARLNDYPKATDWEIAAEAGDADAMYNLAHTYYMKVKDYDKAIYWFKRAYEKDKGSDAANNLAYIYEDKEQYDRAISWYKRASASGNKDAALNLALLYKSKLKNYDKAVEWYKKSYEMGNVGGANSLGYLCELTLHDYVCAKEWYGKAAKRGYTKSINNLGILYHEQGDNVRAAAYYLAWIAYGEPKNDILNFLKNDWKLDRETLQKAYEFQKTLDIPKHYTGGID
jgi:TPR repeat protein